MSFTAADVKALREKTGCGMMDCKKALVSSDGDMEKAILSLREKGLAAAEKKANRVAAEGMVYALVNDVDKIGVAVEVNSETDFVARNAVFQEFVKTVAQTIEKNNPSDVDALLAMKAEGSDRTVEELLHDKVLVIGENIKIRRFKRMEGDICSYIHGGGSIGVLVKFDTDVADKPGFKEYGKNVAMQVAAMNPPYLDRNSVPANVFEEEKKVLTVQTQDEGKPQKIIEKMVTGRLNKFYKEVCLTEQEYIKENKLSVAQYTEQTAKELGGKIKIADFVYFERGQGLQKRDDNLADEIAKMVKK